MMVVEFFGVGGINQLGGTRKPDRPENTQKADKAEKKGTKFSSAIKDQNDVQSPEESMAAARAEKVRALKEQVANGTYQPDLDKVAASILKFVVEDQ